MPPIRARGTRRTAAPVLDQPAVAPPPPPVVGGLPLGVGLEASELARPISLPGLSIETAAYLGLLLVSLLLRVWQIDDMPLSPAESRSALASLEVARGGRFPNEAGALLGMGNALLFAIAGATDPLARALPALLGALVPLAFLPARRLVGRSTTLIAAALATFSPLLIDQSRVVGSAAIAATVSTTLAFCLFSYAARRRPRDLYWSAFLLALTLTAGVAAFSTTIALATFGLAALVARVRERRVAPDLADALAALAPANGHAGTDLPAAEAVYGREHVLRAAGLFLVTLGLIATGALIDVGGVGEGLFAPLGAWFQTFAPAVRTTPLWYPALTLLAYEPLALVLGATGAILALRPVPVPGQRLGSPDLDRFLVWWLLVALVVGLVSPRPDASLLAPALPPAYLLSATVVRRLWGRTWPTRRAAYVASLIVLTWGAAVIAIGVGQATLPDAVGVRYIAAGAGVAEETVRGLVVVFPLALLLGALAYLLTRLGAAGRPALGLAAATWLLAATLHAGWNLAYQVVGNEAELPRSVQTAVDVRALAADVDEVVQVLTINRKDKTLSVTDGLRFPLAWYLKDKSPRIEPRVNGTPAMSILPVDAKPPAARYAGQRYRVTERSDLAFANLAQLWRWLLYRENPSSVQGEDVTLYVRSQ